jgi:hypothetical protein
MGREEREERERITNMARFLNDTMICVGSLPIQNAVTTLLWFIIWMTWLGWYVLPRASFSFSLFILLH